MFEDAGFHIGRDGAFLDEFGGLIDGSPETCLRNLAHRAEFGRNVLSLPPEIFYGNSGADCMRRQKEIERAQKEHARVFQARFKLPWEVQE